MKYNLKNIDFSESKPNVNMTDELRFKRFMAIKLLETAWDFHKENNELPIIYASPDAYKILRESEIVIEKDSLVTLFDMKLYLSDNLFNDECLLTLNKNN
jgi:hypothetical protein